MFVPTFVDVEIDGEARTAVRLSIEANSRELQQDPSGDELVARSG